jgi:hypothetical protein
MNAIRGILTVLALGGAAALASAQTVDLRPTNTSGLQPYVFNGHDLTELGVGLHGRGTPIDPAAYAPDPAILAAGPQAINTGGVAPVIFTGHDLTTTPQRGPLDMILYAPSESDDPTYRAAISAAAGGATVDYFDARVATPDMALLNQYDAVHTWANYAYADNVLFGDNLAAYNDLGGNVVLGVFCTYTSMNYLSGAIMTPAYCPVVSPLGNNHFSTDTYIGDGVTCIYDNVQFPPDSYYRDYLVPQGRGVVDGRYFDQEICHAYRPDAGDGKGDVIYSNGSGCSQLGGGGDWPIVVANSALCGAGAPPVRILYAPSDPDDVIYRAAIAAAAGGAVVDYYDARAGTPDLALLSTYDFVHTWANYAYADNVAMGDNLADYNDIGGNVVLGVFCTYTTGNYLSGRIMTPAYSPVYSPTGTNHFSPDTYAGDGFSCIYNGVVVPPSASMRDYLKPQGAGVIDGTYLADGEIMHAYRQNFGGIAGTVVYSNAAGGYETGDWAKCVANAGLCGVGNVQASCNFVNGSGINPSDFFCATNPVLGTTWQSTVNTTPLVGTSTISTVLGVGTNPGGGFFLFGWELLVFPTYILFQPGFGAHAVPIPNDGTLHGVKLFSQAGRIEMTIATPVVVLTNAQYLLLGY